MLAYPQIFISGDLDPDQPRPIPIKNESFSWQEKFLDRISRLGRVKRHDTLVFNIMYLIKKIQAYECVGLYLHHNKKIEHNYPHKSRAFLRQT